MKSFPWKLTVGIISVFLAGMACSALLIGILAAKGSRDPDIGKQRLLRTMTRVLKLDDQQQEEVAVIVDDIVLDTRTQVGSVIDEHSPRIRAVLNPKQNERFTFFLGKVGRHLHVELEKESESASTAAPVDNP